MYLVGAPHPHKIDAQRVVEAALVAGERLVTDADVLQPRCAGMGPADHDVRSPLRRASGLAPGQLRTASQPHAAASAP
jgi:hypothetical protein